jgi:hypothetical protein
MTRYLTLTCHNLTRNCNPEFFLPQTLGQCWPRSYLKPDMFISFTSNSSFTQGAVSCHDFTLTSHEFNLKPLMTYPTHFLHKSLPSTCWNCDPVCCVHILLLRSSSAKGLLHVSNSIRCILKLHPKPVAT